MIFLMIAIVIRIISNPISNVFQKQLTIVHHPFFVNLVSYAILSLISLFLIYDFPLHTISNDFWIYSILGGICGALGNGFIVKALEQGQLSVLGPINAYKSLVGVAFAFLIIGELPNICGFVGIAFIILGSYFVFDNEDGHFSWSIFNQKAIHFRLAALLLTGIQAVLDKKVIQQVGLTYAFAGWCIFGFIFSVPLFLTTHHSVKAQWKEFSKIVMLKYVGLVISIAMMVTATNYAFAHMQVGTALALFQISILISVLFGHHFFQELGLIKKIIGSAIMIVGSILILMLN
jgi:drug/metabolite transporter (DMT)-like permease